MWKSVDLSLPEVPAEVTAEINEFDQMLEDTKNRGQAVIDASLAKPKRKKMIVSPKGDMVNSPAHYIVGGVETIDFIEAKGLGYHLGNCIKYISRADYKGDRLEDLKKARWYLQREIDRLEKADE